ncbi:MAG: PKD domain-containing protein, partial [Candidatus Marinimicrobia bacterium]|nr:PKD domain-containing protein [Candidatus Neomarinimicrobiota bacterium]
SQSFPFSCNECPSDLTKTEFDVCGLFPCNNEAVRVDISWFHPGGWYILTYGDGNQTFGDDTPGTKMFTHCYNTAPPSLNEFTVTLEIEGCPDTIFIHVGPLTVCAPTTPGCPVVDTLLANIDPGVCADTDPLGISAPVSFVAIPGGDGNYNWNFGDGGTATGPTPAAHPYNTTGRFKVTLTVASATDTTVAELRGIVIVDEFKNDFGPVTAPDAFGALPSPVANPEGIPVQITVKGAPGCRVDLQLSIDNPADPNTGKAHVSLDGFKENHHIQALPQYFSLVPDSTGFASGLVYVQGKHFNTIEDNIAFVV